VSVTPGRESRLRLCARVFLPPQDRRWLDALLAEAGTIEDRRTRIVWLLGGVEFIVLRRLKGIDWLTCTTVSAFALAVLSLILAVTEYEARWFDDDFYPGAFVILVALGLSAILARSRGLVGRAGRG
jgi:hypothetical protein